MFVRYIGGRLVQWVSPAINACTWQTCAEQIALKQARPSDWSGWRSWLRAARRFTAPRVHGVLAVRNKTQTSTAGMNTRKSEDKWVAYHGFSHYSRQIVCVMCQTVVTQETGSGVECFYASSRISPLWTSPTSSASNCRTKAPIIRTGRSTWISRWNDDLRDAM